MNNYNDATRGRFQCEEYAKQLVSFEGMLFTGQNGMRNVTPTDIDGLVHLINEKCIILYEFKYSGDLPVGQRRALEAICDSAEADGKNGVVFVANHNTPPTQTVIARDAIVRKVYWRGKWYPVNATRRVYEMTLKFIEYIKNEEAKKCRELN